MGGDQRHAPAALPPGKRPGTHCTGVLVGPRAGLDGCGKSRPPPRFDPRTAQPVALYRRTYPGPSLSLCSTVSHSHSLQNYSSLYFYPAPNGSTFPTFTLPYSLFTNADLIW